ncbi:hypothetical protein CASFOL_027154 [Castilleja foliolosa]|uniref:Uncharacterized protein n=1 Tax=Castilleja foliolosa TaxID=1961234 RepID=A0ABD3CE01_9LAMI
MDREAQLAESELQQAALFGDSPPHLADDVVFPIRVPLLSVLWKASFVGFDTFNPVLNCRFVVG